jgi:hypothetical protein
MSDTHHQPSTDTTPAPPRGQDIRFGFVFLMLFVGAVVIFCLIMGIQAWFKYEQGLELQAKSLDQTNWELNDLRTTQVQKITSWRWIDQKSGVTAVPIERAMTMTVTHYAGKKSGK